MSKKKSPPRRRKGRAIFLVILLFLAAAGWAGYQCLFRAPEQNQDSVLSIPANQINLPNSTNTSSQQQQGQKDPLPIPSHSQRKENFYTILLSGVDDHSGGSDTNILLAIDAENDSVYGVSIPRDTKAEIEGKYHKINYAYNAGGMELLADVVSQQLGIPIDYTVKVNLKGFVALVDAVGGVQFDVPVNMHYEDPTQDLYIHINRGYQTLNGEKALKVVRFREGYASQDIGRMETQQAFLKAAAQQVLTLSNLDKIDQFVNIFLQYVETDLTLGNLAWLGREVIAMGGDAIQFSTLPGEWSSPYIYLDAEATLELINNHLNPFVEDRLPEDLNIPE